MVILYDHEFILMNDISGAMRPSLPFRKEKAFLMARRGKTHDTRAERVLQPKA